MQSCTNFGTGTSFSYGTESFPRKENLMLYSKRGPDADWGGSCGGTSAPFAGFSAASALVRLLVFLPLFLVAATFSAFSAPLLVDTLFSPFAALLPFRPFDAVPFATTTSALLFRFMVFFDPFSSPETSALPAAEDDDPPPTRDPTAFPPPLPPAVVDRVAPVALDSPQPEPPRPATAGFSKHATCSTRSVVHPTVSASSSSSFVLPTRSASRSIKYAAQPS
mmetsp:Transcript_28238/g.71681  ORF Transcript_28238/g.71681 Transcript_28238/m.71681 type:complete len:222 (+) Transcript_28238:1424-2089(+)